VAIVDITTTHGAVATGDRARLATELAALTYEAEGFAGSAVAPAVCWTFFNEGDPGAISTGAGLPAAALYYIQVTVLADAIDKSRKQKLGEAITSTLLAYEAQPVTPDDRNRVWVRFIDVVDGDLVVGGQSTSLIGLKALVAAQG
jgi:phenylpyruvate tautomerase PptA (4-oxalocrotonate tautomerase family)